MRLKGTTQRSEGDLQGTSKGDLERTVGHKANLTIRPRPHAKHR